MDFWFKTIRVIRITLELIGAFLFVMAIIYGFTFYTEFFA